MAIGQDAWVYYAFSSTGIHISERVDWQKCSQSLIIIFQMLVNIVHNTFLVMCEWVSEWVSSFLMAHQHIQCYKWLVMWLELPI